MMISSKHKGGTAVSTLTTHLGHAIDSMPPSSSLSYYEWQAGALLSDTTRHESASSLADSEDISITTLWPHIIKFRKDHQRAVAFDDDDEYIPNFLSHYDRLALGPICATAPVFQLTEISPASYPTDRTLDPNATTSKRLDPAAREFKYQSSTTNIQETAPGADQQALQPQEPILELSAPEFLAEAKSGPTSQPHMPRQETIRLRDLPYHPKNIRNREKAARDAQSHGLADGGGVANGNGAAHSFGPARSKGPSNSGSSKGSNTPNKSPKARRTRRNTPSPTLSSPSLPSQSGSNSPMTQATIDTSLSNSSTSSPTPSYKLEDPAGSSNSVIPLAFPGPSREPRSSPAATGKVSSYAKSATTSRPPPAPTTGRAGVSAAAHKQNWRGAGAGNWLQ